MLSSLRCSVVIMLYCYCVTLLLFVSSYVLIVCTVPLPPGVNPIAVDKYIYLSIITEISNFILYFLSSSLLSKNIKSEIYSYRIIILHVVLCGCGTWLLTLREERKLRVSENRVLRRIFGAKRVEATGDWRKLQMRNLMICTPHQILFG